MAFFSSRSPVFPTLSLFGIAAFCLLAPPQARAIPAFARKYDVKCYTCHTIPPALNKTGYIFKRLGYRFPPDEMDGTKAAPKIRDLDKNIKFNITNSLAMITQGSFSVNKTTGDTPSSSSSFNLDEAALFIAGSVPDSNFSYFGHLELSQNGQNTAMEQAIMQYTAGRANSSYFFRAGMMHVQEGEGTRAAMMYNLFPDPSMILTDVNPLNFSLDQHPVGVAAGYTWASNYFKQVFAVTGKVTNGLNADGSEIITGSTKNSKDIWFDADYWFGPDGGLTFMTYRGTKDQVQNPGADNEFTYRPVIRRYGGFGNYYFFDKLDVLGGYLRSDDDWMDVANGGMSRLTTNGYRGEVDYYFKPGTAAMARVDYLARKVDGQDFGTARSWGIGALHALTERGNVVLRGTYTQERDTDPSFGQPTVSKNFVLDLRVMW
jgi:hypothetical protein